MYSEWEQCWHAGAHLIHITERSLNFSGKFPILNFFHFAEFKWDVFLLMFSKHWISNHSFLSFSTFKPLNTDIWLERCECRCLNVVLRFSPLLFLCFLCYLSLPHHVPRPHPSGVEEKEWNCKAADFPKLGGKMKLKTLMTFEKFNFLIFKGFGTFSGKGVFFPFFFHAVQLYLNIFPSLTFVERKAAEKIKAATQMDIRRPSPTSL